MFNMLPITGDSLPIGTFVLTYDDGPGPNTQPIAEYLSSMGIAATFFVVGEFAERQPRVLTRLRALGHRLGNHTWTHDRAGLPGQLARGGAVADEVRRTAALLDAGDEPIAFRAPYGSWDSAVATALNADPDLADAHTGPLPLGRRPYRLGGVAGRRRSFGCRDLLSRPRQHREAGHHPAT